jgi:hypothetical protein
LNIKGFLEFFVRLRQKGFGATDFGLNKISKQNLAEVPEIE